jgi:hypothetical protein
MISAWTRNTIERVPGSKAALALWTKPRQIPGKLPARSAATNRRGAVDWGSSAIRSRIRCAMSADGLISVDRRKDCINWSAQSVD